MHLAEILKKGQFLVQQNATALLTSVGVVGTVSTAVLTGRAAWKSALEIEHVRFLNSNDPEFTRRQQIEMVWTNFIPPVGVGTLTITSIIMANRLSAKEAAALAAAYGLSEQALEEYKAKVVERLGEGKEQKIRDEIAQDRVERTHEGAPIVVPGSGDVLCLDLWTGRYFQSTVEKIRKAENDVNYEIVQGMYASASSFYEELGLEATEMTDLLGWNINNRLEVTIASALAPNSQPCVTISPTPPIHNYHKLY